MQIGDISSVEPLLAPIAGLAVCGPDLADDLEYVTFTALVRENWDDNVAGADGGHDSSAELARWREVEKLAKKLFERTKDLWIASYLCIASVRLRGFEGLNEGLMLVRGLLERYWDHVHPGRNDDPEYPFVQRVYAIEELNSVRFLRAVRGAVLCPRQSQGKLALRDLLIATGDLQPVPGYAPIDLPGLGSTVRSALTDHRVESETNFAALHSCLEQLHAIVKVQEEKLTSKDAATLPDLIRILTVADNFLYPIVKGGAAFHPNGSSENGNGTHNTALGAPGARITHENNPAMLRSREDVTRLLDLICDFYTATEPSSPVPLLLQRAKKLVPMNFLQIIENLSPDAMGDIQKVSGRISEST